MAQDTTNSKPSDTSKGEQHPTRDKRRSLSDSQTRLARLKLWGRDALVEMGYAEPDSISTVSDDASFRRYFRARTPDTNFILVDAPPDKEDNESFVAVQKKLLQRELRVPHILCSNLDEGFLLLSDLGDDQLLPALQQNDLGSQEQLYSQALLVLENLRQVDAVGLPEYDEERLSAEMQLFEEWFFQQFPSLAFGSNIRDVLDKVKALMLSSALEQPCIFVHRDFHARNLMLVSPNQLAMIDFQDAVSGPITYDLVSLLKDCYWRLPRSSVVRLVEDFRLMCGEPTPAEQFLRWFDFMGFQRHLKCAGIFSRLNLRDGKSVYLGDIPLVVDYLYEVTEIYAIEHPELADFGAWLVDEVQPVIGRPSQI